MSKYHGGHVVLSFDWEGADWWKPKAYLVPYNTFTGKGHPIGGFVGILGFGIFFILYRRL